MVNTSSSLLRIALSEAVIALSRRALLAVCLVWGLATAVQADELSAKSSELEQLQSQIGKLERSQREAKYRLDDLNTQEMQVLEKLEEAKDAMWRAREAQVSARYDLEKSESDAAELELKKADLAYERSERVLSMLQSRLERVKRNLGEARNEYEKEILNRNELEQALDMLRQQVASLKADREQKQQLVDDAKARRDAEHSAKQQAQQELSELRKKKADLESKLQAEREALREAELRAAELARQQQALRDAKVAVQAEPAESLVATGEENPPPSNGQLAATAAPAEAAQPDSAMPPVGLKPEDQQQLDELLQALDQGGASSLSDLELEGDVIDKLALHPLGAELYTARARVAPGVHDFAVKIRFKKYRFRRVIDGGRRTVDNVFVFDARDERPTLHVFEAGRLSDALLNRFGVPN